MRALSFAYSPFVVQFAKIQMVRLDLLAGSMRNQFISLKLDVKVAWMQNTYSLASYIYEGSNWRLACKLLTWRLDGARFWCCGRRHTTAPSSISGKAKKHASELESSRARKLQIINGIGGFGVDVGIHYMCCVDIRPKFIVKTNCKFAVSLMLVELITRALVLTQETCQLLAKCCLKSNEN